MLRGYSHVSLQGLRSAAPVELFSLMLAEAYMNPVPEPTLAVSGAPGVGTWNGLPVRVDPEMPAHAQSVWDDDKFIAEAQEVPLEELVK